MPGWPAPVEGWGESWKGWKGVRLSGSVWLSGFGQRAGMGW